MLNLLLLEKNYSNSFKITNAILPVDKLLLSAANNNAVDDGTTNIAMLHSCSFEGAVIQMGLHVFLEEKQDSVVGRFLAIIILLGATSKQALNAMIMGRDKGNRRYKAYIA